MVDNAPILRALFSHSHARNNSELARLLGVSKSKVHDWEKGRYSLTLAQIARIRDRLGIDVTPLVSAAAFPIQDAPPARAVVVSSPGERYKIAPETWQRIESVLPALAQIAEAKPNDVDAWETVKRTLEFYEVGVRAAARGKVRVRRQQESPTP
jgi:transcriptional regulator with XRE-family HTH domain